MLGSTAGALVGLLFLVMSLNIARFTACNDANVHATIDGSRNNTFRLLTVLAKAAMVLAPQPVLWLGIALIVSSLYGLRFPVGMIVKYARGGLPISERGGIPFAPILTIFIAYLLGASGGVGLLMSIDGAA